MEDAADGYQVSRKRQYAMISWQPSKIVNRDGYRDAPILSYDPIREGISAVVEVKRN